MAYSISELVDDGEDEELGMSELASRELVDGILYNESFSRRLAFGEGYIWLEHDRCDHENNYISSWLDEPDIVYCHGCMKKWNIPYDNLIMMAKMKSWEAPKQAIERSKSQ